MMRGGITYGCLFVDLLAFVHENMSDKAEKIAQVQEWLGSSDELQARALLDATGWDLGACKAMLSESREVRNVVVNS